MLIKPFHQAIYGLNDVLKNANSKIKFFPIVKLRIYFSARFEIWNINYGSDLNHRSANKQYRHQSLKWLKIVNIVELEEKSIFRAWLREISDLIFYFSSETMID